MEKQHLSIKAGLLQICWALVSCLSFPVCKVGWNNRYLNTVIITRSVIWLVPKCDNLGKVWLVCPDILAATEISCTDFCFVFIFPSRSSYVLLLGCELQLIVLVANNKWSDSS